MFKQGIVCKKTTGKEQDKIGVILEVKDNFATIEGEMKKRRVNIMHLEPLGQIEVKKGVTKEVIVKELVDAGFIKGETKEKKVWNKKPKKK